MFRGAAYIPVSLHQDYQSMVMFQEFLAPHEWLCGNLAVVYVQKSFGQSSCFCYSPQLYRVEQLGQTFDLCMVSCLSKTANLEIEDFDKQSTFQNISHQIIKIKFHLEATQNLAPMLP